VKGFCYAIWIFYIVIGSINYIPNDSRKEVLRIFYGIIINKEKRLMNGLVAVRSSGDILEQERITINA
jgi:hypothetical protein